MAARVNFFIKLQIILLIFLPVSQSKCTIDVNRDYENNSPLVLDADTLDFVYPSKKSPTTLNFQSGQRQLLYCSEKAEISNSDKPRINDDNDDRSLKEYQCLRDKKFSTTSQNKSQNFDRILCSKNPNPIELEDKNRSCKNGVVVNIGYQITSDFFKTIIDLCHSTLLSTTYWAHSKLLSIIGSNKNTDFKTPAFSKGSYFKGLRMTKIYPKSSQQQIFMEIFDNDERLVHSYLSTTGEEANFFVKGHLVARADMFYYPEQYSTYFYTNALPMWQSINNGNWKRVENIVRRIAHAEGDLDVWTGGLGILKLNNRNIYLGKKMYNHPISKSEYVIPAPKLLYKLVYNEGTNEAIVFLTINNPYVELVSLKDYKICNEYKSCRDKYEHFEQKFEGYTYCCLYENFIVHPLVQDVDLPAKLDNPKPLKLH